VFDCSLSMIIYLLINVNDKFIMIKSFMFLIIYYYEQDRIESFSLLSVIILSFDQH
jgi:hypothetical protein